MIDGDAVFAPVTLDLGVNTIQGFTSVALDDDGNLFPDYDAFNLIVGAGLRITNVSLFAGLFDSGQTAGRFIDVTWSFAGKFETTPLEDGGTLIPSAFASALPLGPGQYALATSSFLISFDDDGLSALAFYTVNVTTERMAVVPLPAGGALLAGALGVMALVRRRRA